MLKRTIYVSSPFYLHTTYQQLVLTDKTLEKTEASSIPIEDIGYLILDHRGITISQTALQRLLDNNTAVIYCDAKHYPAGLLLPFQGHHTHNQRIRAQLNASKAATKQMWRQTVRCKIKNQANLLEKQGGNILPLQQCYRSVKSGDSTYQEGLAAKYYWPALLGEDFIRDRYGSPPNNLLNYGYILLRSAMARALCGVGLLVVWGIQHHNKYSAFCLADDIMEPYRPFVDEIVLQLYDSIEADFILSKEIKMELLQILNTPVKIKGQFSPLSIALNKTASSLVQCFEGKRKKILYPELI